ncbi:uncharacterized protein METZ01_LOCUS372833, partial [marine metagenome]
VAQLVRAVDSQDFALISFILYKTYI